MDAETGLAAEAVLLDLLAGKEVTGVPAEVVQAVVYLAPDPVFAFDRRLHRTSTTVGERLTALCQLAELTTEHLDTIAGRAGEHPLSIAALAAHRNLGLMSLCWAVINATRVRYSPADVAAVQAGAADLAVERRAILAFLPMANKQVTEHDLHTRAQRLSTAGAAAVELFSTLLLDAAVDTWNSANLSYSEADRLASLAIETLHRHLTPAL